MAENGKEASAVTDLEQRIIKQVEYYFGDINLPRDRFLQDQIMQDDGWVTLDTMLKFNRLSQICDDKEAICTALGKSVSGLMEVSEDKSKIRRNPDMPIPENTKERREDLASRSLYTKGFPLEHTLDEIQAFFAKHGKMDSIQMRRKPKTKNFKGSVFVVFHSKEDAEKFLKAESVKCGETELVRLMKSDYFKKKTEERKGMQQKLDEPSKEQEAEEIEQIKEKIKLATILHLDGLPGDITIEDVRNFFSDFGKVLWVDHEKGETKGYVRFAEKDEATEVLTKATEAGEGKIEINNNEIQARVLEGDEELNYWKIIFKATYDKRKNRHNQAGGRWGHRRNDRYGGSGHKGSKKRHSGNKGGDGEPAAKAAKAE